MINYSVIIPHYSKHGTFLLQRSVLSIPERNDIEVLIVDNSLSPIDQDLFKERINTKIYYSDNRLGAGGARNIGLSYARGKWILFLDSDDYFLDNAFFSFDKYLYSDNDVIYFKLTSSFSDTGKPTERHCPYCKMIDDYLLFNNDFPLRINHCVPWCKMIRHDFLIDNHIVFDEVPASNDVIFALNIGLKANKIEADNSLVYCLTITKGSITNTESLRNIESIFNVKIRKNQLLKENGYKPVSSVAYQIYRASKYGFKPFIKLFYTAFVTGNLFVGYRNWIKTIISFDKKYKEYIEKE